MRFADVPLMVSNVVLSTMLKRRCGIASAVFKNLMPFFLTSV